MEKEWSGGGGGRKYWEEKRDREMECKKKIKKRKKKGRRRMKDTEWEVLEDKARKAGWCRCEKGLIHGEKKSAWHLPGHGEHH